MESATDPAGTLNSGKNLVAAYLEQGQAGYAPAYGYAVNAARNLLYDHPNDWELLYHMGEGLLLDGDPEGAVAAWEKAKAQAGAPDWLADRIQKLADKNAVQQERGFVAQESMHFSIQFQDEEETAVFADQMLTLLEDAYVEIGNHFALYPDHKIYVSIYFSSDFSKAVRIPWAGGVHSQNRIELKIAPDEDVESYRDTILHEYAHHLIALKANQMKVPTWLNEGMAMHVERGLDRSPFRKALSEQLYGGGGGYLPFDGLSNGFTGMDSDQALLAYAQATDMVEFLIERLGFHKLVEVLEALGDGTEFGTAFHRATYVSFPYMEQEWVNRKADEAPGGAADDLSHTDSGVDFEGLEGNDP